MSVPIVSVPIANGMMQPKTPAPTSAQHITPVSNTSKTVDKNDAQSLIKDGPPPSPDEIKDAAVSIEKFIQSHSNTQVQFSVDKDTDLAVVKVIDKATDEVIAQIPSKEIIALAQAIDKLQGLMSMKGVLLPTRSA